ncbi:MAG: hypothetical protein LBQ22_10395 [Bacteroidales bacterium]|jgi:hypothetical protein|nr:hypothetical protein [Bacteroidales bacterium]
MKKIRFLMPVGFLLIAAGFSAVVMLLWNWLMPSIFGLITINFWQALGILVLARILFGGFKAGKMMNHKMHQGHHNSPMHDKWMKMSPEQRMEFIEKRRKFGFGHQGREEFFGKEFYADNKTRESGNDNE